MATQANKTRGFIVALNAERTNQQPGFMGD